MDAVGISYRSATKFHDYHSGLSSNVQLAGKSKG